jgi:hypothetical protein
MGFSECYNMEAPGEFRFSFGAFFLFFKNFPRLIIFNQISKFKREETEKEKPFWPSECFEQQKSNDSQRRIKYVLQKGLYQVCNCL